MAPAFALIGPFKKLDLPITWELFADIGRL